MPRTCFNGDGDSSYLSVAGLECYDLPCIFRAILAVRET